MTEQEDKPVDDELARRVNYLYDRAMISEAVHRYFLALDEKRWDDLYEVLDDEFLLAAAPIAGDLGRQPIGEFMEGLIARNGGFAGTVHLNSDHIISIDG